MTRRAVASLAAATAGLLLTCAPTVLGATTETSDPRDSSQPDIRSLSHDATTRRVAFSLSAHEAVDPAQVRSIRWDLDFERDDDPADPTSLGTATAPDSTPSDGCIIVKRAERRLAAKLFDACDADGGLKGTAVASTKVSQPTPDAIRFGFTADDLLRAGLAEDDSPFAYRVLLTGADGGTDRAPDTGWIEVTPQGAPRKSTRAAARQQGSPSASPTGTPGGTPDGSPTPTPTTSPAATPDPDNTQGTGEASVDEVAAGGSVEVTGDGFAPNETLFFRLHTATDTATQAPTPTPATPTPSPASAQDISSQIAARRGATVRPLVVPEPDTSAAAAQAASVSLGNETSDDDGSFRKLVTIPRTTTRGNYVIVVTGPNAAEATHIVRIPITVTAATGAPNAGAGSGLPTNGSPYLLPMARTGALLVVTGLLLLAAGRSFRRRPPARARS